MREITKKVLVKVLTEQFGGLGEDDVTMLLLDPATAGLPVLMRYTYGREVIPMSEVENAVKIAGDELRDVQFNAITYDGLCVSLGLPKPQVGFTVSA